MRHEYEQAASKTDPNDPHLRQAHAAYLRASEVLHTKITRQSQADPNGSPVINETSIPDCTIGTQIIPAAEWPQGSLRRNIDCFNFVNKSYLDRAYDSATGYLRLSLALVSVSSLILCGLLLFTTWRMATITHRLINLGLTFALLGGLVQSLVVIAHFGALGGQQGTFKQLVRDSYDSVYYTNILRRYGTAANADESRWLVATQFGDPAGADRWFKDWQANSAQVQTYIDRAISNETFPEERGPLSVIQRDWNAYSLLDAQIRQRASATNSPERIADAQRLSTGDSNAAFGVFIDTTNRLGDVNRDYFNRIYRTTHAMLSSDILWSTILFPLVGLAAVWGIWQRLKDF
jgi:hypothetical protein